MTAAAAPIDFLVLEPEASRHPRLREQLRLSTTGSVTVVSTADDAVRKLGMATFGLLVIRVGGQAATNGMQAPSSAALFEAYGRGPVVAVAMAKSDLAALGIGSERYIFVPEDFASDLLTASIASALDAVSLQQRLSELEVALSAEQDAVRRLNDRIGQQIHRSKNLLAIVQSIAHRSLADGRSLAEARDALMGRLRSISRAHHLNVSSTESGPSIADLVEAQLGDAIHSVSISGPQVRVRGAIVQTFGLAVHELVTNAKQHGALASGDGTVAIGWTLIEDADGTHVDIVWREAGGGPVAQPSHQGFGLALVSSLAGGLSPSVTFDPDGFQCRMRIAHESVTS